MRGGGELIQIEIKNDIYRIIKIFDFHSFQSLYPPK